MSACTFFSLHKNVAVAVLITVKLSLRKETFGTNFHPYLVTLNAVAALDFKNPGINLAVPLGNTFIFLVNRFSKCLFFDARGVPTIPIAHEQGKVEISYHNDNSGFVFILYLLEMCKATQLYNNPEQITVKP